MDSTAGNDTATWWVACLCAAWCGVCRDWQPQFIAQAHAHPGLRFAWVDVEDEDETMGEVDIVTFPTLLVARGEQVMYLAPIPPLDNQFTRLLARLQAQQAPDPGVPAGADALLARLREDVLPRTVV
ncbi:thioredoxin family protein [Ramlibacter ginsenosidimutans]|uniref:Thioredoxin family protein n=1 Tax=Ramlibacter ginsenosidimutans TaxID=502333 RepID=A0A934TSK9_9BURK|nr:thioredoxin family protein [Ramlibacter ginsenosidimutans]MBK6006175.1 thioredoxin family protein [Ramlibacter ginsenosidimutans]